MSKHERRPPLMVRAPHDERSNPYAHRMSTTRLFPLILRLS